MARYRLRAVAGIPEGSISPIMSIAMRRGTNSLDEALELAKRVAYDAAWPILIQDTARNDLTTHRVSVLGVVMRLTVSAEPQTTAIVMPVK